MFICFCLGKANLHSFGAEMLYLHWQLILFADAEGMVSLEQAANKCALVFGFAILPHLLGNIDAATARSSGARDRSIAAQNHFTLVGYQDSHERHGAFVGIASCGQ